MLKVMNTTMKYPQTDLNTDFPLSIRVTEFGAKASSITCSSLNPAISLLIHPRKLTSMWSPSRRRTIDCRGLLSGSLQQLWSISTKVIGQKSGLLCSGTNWPEKRQSAERSRCSSHYLNHVYRGQEGGAALSRISRSTKDGLYHPWPAWTWGAQRPEHLR